MKCDLFISQVYTTEKSDGSPRLILSMKKFNCSRPYPLHQALETSLHKSIIYINGAYMQVYSYNECYNNINLLMQLGFTINLQKSVLHPMQKIGCFGFILDSQLMTITLSMKQIDK